MRKLLLVVLAAALLPNLCWGWGREGHRIVAAVAEHHLDETTKVMIQSLIGNNHLYSIAPWADDVRRERRETGPWHYVNIPLGAEYDASRDCAPPRGCVVAKTQDLVKVLVDKKAPREQRAEALKFLVHFVGDVHQPMHAVKEAEGGNGVHVSFVKSTHCGPYECNLHGVWDTSMILRTGLNQQDYVARLEALITGDKLESQSGGTPEQWTNDSLKLAKAAWVQNGVELDDRYYQQQIKFVDRQMALAGLRLAHLLNDTIGKLTPRDFASAQETAHAQTPQSSAPTASTDGSSVKVWVNTTSGVYHCPNTQWYGNTKRGEYMPETEAQNKGFHGVGGRSCH